MNPSAAPPKINCGTNKNALIGSTETLPVVDFATLNLLVSTTEATAVANIENTSPTSIFCRFVKPVHEK